MQWSGGKTTTHRYLDSSPHLAKEIMDSLWASGKGQSVGEESFTDHFELPGGKAEDKSVIGQSLGP